MLNFAPLMAEIESGSKSTSLPSQYCEAGLVLVSIPKGKKGPNTLGWNKRENCVFDPEKAATLAGNIGLAHSYSRPRTAVIDVDDYRAANNWLADRGIDLDALLTAPDAVHINSGLENRAKLLYRLTGDLDGVPTIQPSGSGLEFRCATGNGLTMQDVLPPSIHPDTGKPYEWGGNGDWRNLPEIPAAVVDLWCALIRQPANEPVGTIEKGPIPVGQRNTTYFKLAAGMRRQGMTPEAIETRLAAQNAECGDGLANSEIKTIARSAGKYPPTPDRLEPNSQTPADEWPEPMELPDLKLPVMAFDFELLPGALRPFVRDIAERMQCPSEFPAVAVTVAAGSVIGRQCAIRPKRNDDWTVVPNLWGGCIGRPSVMKSPALKQALRPLQRLIYDAQEAHAEESKSASNDAQVAKAKLMQRQSKINKSAAADDDTEMFRLATEMTDLLEIIEAEVTERRYMVNDPTVEKLGELLCLNSNGLLSFRDELIGWLHNLDREEKSNDRSFYLESWAGDGRYVYDRIARGTVVIEAACVSVLGGIQPGPLAQYVAAATANRAGADGLLQRFQLLVWPDDPGKWINVDRWPDSAAKEQAFEVFRRLASLNMAPAQSDGEDDIPFLRFDALAQEIFDSWLNNLMNEKVRDLDSEALESHLSKFRSLVPSLALIIHLSDNGGGPVSEGALISAIGWAEYLESHARRVYAHGVGGGIPEARALASRIKAGDLGDEFTMRFLQRKQWRCLTRRQDVDRAVETLEAFDWLRVERRDTGGRQSEICVINPRLVA